MIRAATASDAPALLALHRVSILALCRAHYSSEQLAHWTGPLRAELYVSLLATHQVLVHARGEALDGFGVLDLESGLINASYVAPHAVRQGVGRALLGAMEQRAQASGLPQLALHATLNAVGFYTKLGYLEDRPASNRLPSGVELPCVRMHKPLPAP